MRKRAILGWVLVGVPLWMMAGLRAEAQSPGSSQSPGSWGGGVEYRVLSRPSTGHGSASNVPQAPKPFIVPQAVQPYAYGWFGSKTQMHFHRQFGNRRNYTQWTLK